MGSKKLQRERELLMQDKDREQVYDSEFVSIRVRDCRWNDRMIG